MYQIIFSKSAEKELAKLPNDIIARIVEMIEILALNPRISGYKKLEGFKDFYRVRVGDYRVIYKIEDKILTVEIVKISHRKSVYKK